MSEEKVIEIKFDSSKEKIFIITKRYLTTQEMERYLELLSIMNKKNIFILPADLIESIKVIRDIKEEANSYEKLANELKFKRTFEK
ncbi:hypothetical protein LCGC14_1766490 [marine sediment metagenome]|uniref:Uncharacterized protein n=1 Tax=marine sediment metagenome TaxID=412755 RepID=A0A0F9GZH4_9ZZZZ